MFSKTDIEKYFLAEKQESLVFMIIGILALLLALYLFFFVKTNFNKGAAIPFLVIGLIQIVVGFTVYNRSDDDRIKNVYAYDMNPDQLKNEELPRIKKVNKNFITYRWIEIVCFLTGAGLVFYFKADTSQSFWYGFGLALAIQAFIMLGADYFAEKRARFYAKGLETYTFPKSRAV
jgi:hypothetical protein